MNRRGFLASLVVLPAAIKALSKPDAWVRNYDACTFEWRHLYSPVIITDVEVVGGEETLLKLMELKIKEATRSMTMALEGNFRG